MLFILNMFLNEIAGFVPTACTGENLGTILHVFRDTVLRDRPKDGFFLKDCRLFSIFCIWTLMGFLSLYYTVL
jgi:hypothetical protein